MFEAPKPESVPEKRDPTEVLADEAKEAGRQLQQIENAMRAPGIDPRDPALLSRLNGLMKQLNGNVTRMEDLARKRMEVEGRMRGIVERDQQMMDAIIALRTRMDQVQAKLTLSGAAEWSAFVEHTNATLQKVAWFRMDPRRLTDPAVQALEAQYKEARKQYNDNYVEGRPDGEPDAATLRRFGKMMDAVMKLDALNEQYFAARNSSPGSPPRHVSVAKREAEEYMQGGQKKDEIIGYMESLWTRWDAAKIAMKTMSDSPALQQVKDSLEDARVIYRDSFEGLNKRDENYTIRAMMAKNLIEAALDAFDNLPKAPQTPASKQETDPPSAPPVQPRGIVTPEPEATPQTTPKSPSAPPATSSAEPSPTPSPAPTPGPIPRPVIPRRVIEPQPGPSVIPPRGPMPRSTREPEIPDVTVPVEPMPEETPSAPQPAVPSAPPSAPAEPAPTVPSAPEAKEAPEVSPDVTVEDRNILVRGEPSLSYVLDNGSSMRGLTFGRGSVRVDMPGRFVAERTRDGWSITPAKGVTGTFFLTIDGRETEVRIDAQAVQTTKAPKAAPSRPAPSATPAPMPQPQPRTTPTYATQTTPVRRQPVRNFFRRVFRGRR